MHRQSVESVQFIHTIEVRNDDKMKFQKNEHRDSIENKQHIPIKEGENNKEHRIGKNRLTWLESSLFATILENSLTEINILAECNTEMRITKALSDLPLFLTMKYGLEPEDAKDISRVQNIQNTDYDKLRKYEADRKYFTEVIMGTYMHLNLKHDYEILTGEVNAVIKREEEKNNLYDQEVKNNLIHHELHKQIRQQRNHLKTVVYDTDAAIESLIRKVQDYTLNAEMRIRYVDNWQRARTEQHCQMIYDEESYPLGLIEHYKQRIDQEQRIHADVVLLINVAIDELSVKVEEWMNKYDVDYEGLELKIQYKKNHYQTAHERRILLEETLEKHDKLMKEWNHFKEERNKARKYIEDMTQSAIIVQAWWRGLLVRQKLGPYKEKKVKGNKNVRR